MKTLTEMSVLLSVLANLSGNGIDTSTINREELLCLSHNVYFESRGENSYGKLGVAHVTLNRVDSEHYPNTICDVVWQKNKSSKTGRWVAMFSWTLDGKPDVVNLDYPGNSQAWRDSVTVSALTMTGILADLTCGSTHFYAHKLVDPHWSRSTNYDKPCGLPDGRVGNHTFLVPTYD
jgi:spore germination cell wall hydrolase CwlJ-like protein